MIERVTYEGELVAVIFRNATSVEDVQFVTGIESSLQVGVLRRDAGQVADPHYHLYEPQVIRSMQEVIFVVRGRLRLSMYDTATGLVFASSVLATGDGVVHMAQGHGVEFLEATTIFEVKQGPYPGDAEAKVLLVPGESA
jgi:hypothetical protein